MSTAAYWCELAWLGGERADAGVVVDLDGQRIESVESGLDTPPAGATRLDGLTLPGLANVHSHAFHRALRGRAQRGGGSFWTWREDMYALAARLDPDSYLRLARATFAEMALAGVTSVGEFHYLHHGADGRPYANPNELGEVMIAAAGEAGIRITLLDACYLRGGIGEPLNAVQRRFADADADAWAARAGELAAVGEGMRVGAAIHSVRAVDPESSAVVASWARERGAPLHAHVSEQPAENEACAAEYGATPTGVLAAAGALDERFAAVHATHVRPSDIDALGTAGCCCCLCPTTERDLADGIGPAGALAEAGTSLAVGSDSHAVIDLFEEARAVELDQRLEMREARAPPSGRVAARGDQGWSRRARVARGRDAQARRRGRSGDDRAGRRSNGRHEP